MRVYDTPDLSPRCACGILPHPRRSIIVHRPWLKVRGLGGEGLANPPRDAIGRNGSGDGGTPADGENSPGRLRRFLVGPPAARSPFAGRRPDEQRDGPKNAATWNPRFEEGPHRFSRLLLVGKSLRTSKATERSRCSYIPPVRTAVYRDSRSISQRAPLLPAERPPYPRTNFRYVTRCG